MAVIRNDLTPDNEHAAEVHPEGVASVQRVRRVRVLLNLVAPAVGSPPHGPCAVVYDVARQIPGHQRAVVEVVRRARRPEPVERRQPRDLLVVEEGEAIRRVRRRSW